ncbi:hypothetical protein GOB46_25460 [Sinorhizobium meliloti]|nr:hypothetical protein [Sinorhizobium meliloti]MDW9511213.1 hypothetical protein [Sinorhizobium meliloti]MDW9809151.1 hypothetical protein [Sinorhizobium meliloti]MDW9855903.1 hypothetical protein [Sinorhizobium meliloti]MDW9874546.1 hypothetical protein [Sinorhizobium meliloti]
MGEEGRGHGWVLAIKGHHRLLHVSFNRIRLKDKNMQQIKVLQRPLRA